MKNLVVVLVLVLAAFVQAEVEVLLWDFETDLGPWGSNDGCTVTLGTNPLTSSQCMVITPDAGFSWGAYASAAMDIVDFTATPTIQLEVSWVASEWEGLDWLNQEQYVVNSGPGGWVQVVATDEQNPDYPGSWDPAWGDNTRTLRYDFTGYPNPTEWGTQMGIAVNWGTTTSGLPGNFYIDNIKAVGPDPINFSTWSRYECEDAELTYPAYINDDADCSNGQYVSIQKDGTEMGAITITVNAPRAGTYNMRYGQWAWDLERYEDFYVNDVEIVDQQFAGHIDWTAAEAVEGNNNWDDAVVIQDLFDSVVLYGQEDGNWQIWSRWAAAWNADLLNVPMTVDLLEGKNTISVAVVWGWDDWDYFEVELGYIPRNPSPADGSIAVIAETTELSWDNAIDGLEKVEVWFGETPEPNVLDPNTFVTSENYKEKLTLIETVTAPGDSSSIAIPSLTHGALYTWVVDGFDAPDGEPNYPGVFWTFEATDNAPPIADAGPDQYVWLDPDSVIVTLDGSASDDGDSGPAEPLTFEWTQIAGPTVTIDDPSAEITTVTITELGNTIEDGAGEPYEFELTVIDTQPWTRTDTVMVYVNSNSCLSTQQHPDGYLFYGDITGPDGTAEVMVPDCKVDLYDFAEIALNWLNCSNLFEACD